MVFIPYCSGDLHWGSQDVTYNDPNTGQSVNFRHRGFDNVMSVLKFITESTDFRPESGTRILVTGQSAGGYGAIFHFPYIAELFPGVAVHVIGDAAGGVVPSAFNSRTESQWGVEANVPDFVTNVIANNFSDGTLSLGDFYERVAIDYPGSRIGQFSTVFDGNQRFFYDVQHRIEGIAPYAGGVNYRDVRNFWGRSDGSDVPNDLSCDWTFGQLVNLRQATSQPNYRYYLAGGDFHTISTSREFYSRIIGRSPVSQFYNSFITGENFETYDCVSERGIANCSPPPSVNLKACSPI